MSPSRFSRSCRTSRSDPVKRSRARTTESIYGLIVERPPAPERPPRYVSKFSGNSVPTASTFGAAPCSQVGVYNLAGEFHPGKPVHDHRQNGFLGPNHSCAQKPTDFLRRRDRTLPAPCATENYIKRHIQRIPSIVHHEDVPVNGLKTTRNYVKLNAIEAMLSEPVIPDRNPSLKNPFCMGKHESFGVVPGYLDQVKGEVQRERKWLEEARSKMNKQASESQNEEMHLPEEERLTLVAALKARWAEVNHSYQAMTHVVKLDTISKVRTKERHEAMLEQLEKDIEKLSRPNIVIRQHA